MNNQLDTITVEGQVLDGQQFNYLYRLFDLERDAAEEWQRLSMQAAFEVLDAFEHAPWREEKQDEWKAYEAQHGVQPPPSVPMWHTREAFYKWVQDCAEREGHPVRNRRTIQNLKNAAECVRIVRSKTIEQDASHDALALPENEFAWRPVYKLLTKGFTDQIVTVVRRAAELAYEEGGPVSSGRMSVAVTEVWNSDPQIREWVEQPGQTVDPRSAHDRVVTALNKIRKEANDLRKQIGDNPKAWNEFLAGLAEIR